MTALEEFAYGFSDLVPNQTGQPDGAFYDVGGTLNQCLHYRRSWEAIPFVAMVSERSTDVGITDDWSASETTEVSATMNAEASTVEDVIARPPRPSMVSYGSFSKYV